jgi:hypothetical protein
MGESQVLVVKDINNDKIYYSAVIDCYTVDGINKTADILNGHGITAINLLCWTHPDDDHSIGLGDIVDIFCNEHTKVLLPEGIYGQEGDFVTYKPEILKFFVAIQSNNAGRKYNVLTATTIPGQVQGVERMKYLEGLREIPFEIHAMAPCSAIIRRRKELGLRTKNDISIALLVTFAELSFFLTGDIEDQTIENLDGDRLATLSYLKTPHHTSTSSEKLLDLFDAVFVESYRVPITCSTAYRRHNLPDAVLIERYRVYSETFYTTHNDTSHERYGVIEMIFDPYDNSYTESLQGSAQRIF